MKLLKICVLGFGHWGPNIVKAFDGHPQAEVVAVVDCNKKRHSLIKEKLPDLQVYSNLKECLKNVEFRAAVITTPTLTHYELALEALGAGKHLLVEKPLAHTTAAASQLVQVAKKKSLTLMTGHIFLYNRGIIEMKRIIESGALGETFYLRSVRTNLGPIRYDVNALWDLAAHDISIANFLFDAPPVEVACSAFPVLGNELEDIAQARLIYPGNKPAILFVSWLDPQKVRQITVVGKKKMIVFDDMNPEQPLRIHDKGVEVDHLTPYSDTFQSFRMSIHSGDVTIPNVSTGSPLAAECGHFVDCVLDGKIPQTDGKNGLEVVKVLEALTESAKRKGVVVSL